MSDAPLIPLRSYQVEALYGKLTTRRTWGLIWSRRRGKSHFLAAKSLHRMATAKQDVYFLSASMKTGQENIRKQVEIWQRVVTELRRRQAGGVDMIDSGSGHSVTDLDLDGLSEVFDASKLQVRLWHSQSSYSRALLIAANPDTAVGYGGSVYMDEAGRMPAFKEVFEAVRPIMQDRPEFELGITTTPPPDDKHASYELLAPREVDFPVSDVGNYYISTGGILVHRVDALDAEAAGMPFLDFDTGQPISVWEARAKDFDKQAFDRNFLCRFIAGGSAAISLQALNHACQAGAGKCVGIFETEELAA